MQNPKSKLLVNMTQIAETIWNIMYFNMGTLYSPSLIIDVFEKNNIIKDYKELFINQ